jgi:DNA-binding XRE family transcriptional regulator
MTTMVELSELTTATEIHQRDMTDPAYRAEDDRTRFANDVAIRVLRYRTDHGLTQTAFGKLVGLRQPHVARLEAGEHEPSLSTLARLSAALGVDFVVDINPNGVRLRESA